MKEAEIKNKLSPAQISVMLHKVTEPPYFGKFWDHFEAGVYRCAACDTALFSSEEKFDSKTGWPSFKRPINEKDLQFKGETGPDDKVEIRCKKCKSHLGYVIAGNEPYYRINSVCMHFAAAAPVPVAASPVRAVEGKKEPVVFPAAAALEVVPQSESPSVLKRTIPGVLVGILLGAGGMWLYLSPEKVPAAPDTATTTVATSTGVLPESLPAEQTRAEPDSTPTETTPEPPVSDTATDISATSTQ